MLRLNSCPLAVNFELEERASSVIPGACTKHFFALFHSCRLSGFGVCFVFVPILSVFLYVGCVRLCSLILHWARDTCAREKVEAWEPETLSTGPLLGPEIVQIFAKCWGGLQSKGCNS